MCMTMSLCYRAEINIINQLCFNKKISLKKSSFITGSMYQIDKAEKIITMRKRKDFWFMMAE